MTFMKFKFRWLAVLVIALLASGCVKVEQTLTLDKDGSGTLDMRYGMSEQTIAQLEAMEQMAETMGQEPGGDPAGETPFDFDEAQVREEFEANRPDGVELLSLNSETVDGWKYMNMQLAFDDMAALRETAFFSDGELTLTKNAEGNYVLSQSTGAASAMPETPIGEGEGAEAAMMQQMAGMFAGMRIVTNVVAPTAVLDSNASEVDGRRASWIFDVDEDPTVLAKLQQMDLRMVFDGKGVDIPEFGATQSPPAAN